MARQLRAEKPELIEKLVQALKIGNHIHVACDFAGISPHTVSHWLRRGAREQMRADDEKIKMQWNRPRYRRVEVPYVKFSREIQQALAFAEVRLATSVSKAAEENWIAAMTMLERRYPERWSRMQRSEISGAGGGPVRIDLGTRRAAMEELEAEWEETAEALPAHNDLTPLPPKEIAYAPEPQKAGKQRQKSKTLGTPAETVSQEPGRMEKEISETERTRSSAPQNRNESPSEETTPNNP